MFETSFDRGQSALDTFGTSCCTAITLATQRADLTAHLPKYVVDAAKPRLHAL